MNLDLSFEAEKFSGWAPLFPLAGVVLLPGALLPLHIFEPRYRAMVRDALEGEKLIAMALLRPGFEPEYLGAPAIEEFVGLGRIVAHEPLADGRSNMLLAGLRRARILEEDRTRPYRRGKLEVLQDEDDAVSAKDTAAFRERLSRLLGRAKEHVRDPVRMRIALEMPALGLGAFVDLIADALALEVGERVLLLRESRVGERTERLIGMLDARLGTGRYPARFSRN
jgi:Lon protease-like protein